MIDNIRRIVSLLRGLCATICSNRRHPSHIKGKHFMENVIKFKNKMRGGQTCLGTAISFSDWAVTEALCSSVDFVWIDMEHNPLTLEAVQGHIMATKGTDVVPIVRVPWNDPVLIKPVLDI